MTPPGGDGRLLVAALVGTDHHPFDRLVRWADAVAQAHPDVDVLVQYGTARSPEHAGGQQIWSKDKLADVLSSAHVVLSHGGPGTITEVRAGGTVPIVLARDPSHGEHVDGHQMRFVARMSAAGLVDEVTSMEELLEQVSRRLGQPRGTGLTTAGDHDRVERACVRFAEVVASLPEPRRVRHQKDRR